MNKFKVGDRVRLAARFTYGPSAQADCDNKVEFIVTRVRPQPGDSESYDILAAEGFKSSKPPDRFNTGYTWSVVEALLERVNPTLTSREDIEALYV